MSDLRNHLFTPRRIRSVHAVLALLLIGSVGCDGRNPFEIPWREAPEVVFLYSIDRPEQNLPTAFDFHNRTQIDLAAPGVGADWDVFVATRDGELVLMTPGAVGIFSEARIAVIPNTTLDDVLVAPTALEDYVIDEPVPVKMGDVYVVRSRRQFDIFGFSCIYYAKATPTEIAPEIQFLRLRFDTNPLCNDPRLKPPS